MISKRLFGLQSIILNKYSLELPKNVLRYVFPEISKLVVHLDVCAALSVSRKTITYKMHVSSNNEYDTVFVHLRENVLLAYLRFKKNKKVFI